MMTELFCNCFDLLMGSEGGYVNDPRDPGGETMWGVTKRVAMRWGYTGPMRNLPKATAMQIAKAEYWDTYNCDLFAPPVAFQVFDTCYNGGHAIQWLQQIASTKETGKALAALLVQINSWEVVAKFNAKRLQYLASLKQPAFADGRMNRIAKNMETGGSLK